MSHNGHARTTYIRVLSFCVALAAAAAMVGCGSYMGSTRTMGSNSMVQVRMGDGPADRVVTFEISAGPIALTPVNGSAITVLSGTRRIELEHLSETSEPLVLSNVPQGTYSSMTVTLANPEITFLNSSGTLTKIEPAFNQTVTVSFSPAVNITAAAAVLNVDLNLANSLTFDAQGNVTGVAISATSFTVSVSANQNENQEEAENGELEDTIGTVNNVSGNSFTMTVGQNGVSLTFTTDQNTEFKDGASLATLVNMIVKVEGVTRSDGTLYAKEVETIENQDGMEAEGLVTQLTGSPATQLSVVAQDGSGAGMDDSKVGAVITADVSGAQYRVDAAGIDTSSIGNLPSSPNFPFDSTTVHAGQSVEVESSNQMSGMSSVADRVGLKQQTLTGLVSGLQAQTLAGPTTFILTVVPDSAFVTLSGQTTVTVFWQPGTNLDNITSIKNGDTVRVRGLVFFASSGVNMIAHRIGD